MRHDIFALTILDNWTYYMGIYALILLFYLIIYRNIYWGIFDPMLLTIVNMVGSVFCVWFLNEQSLLKPIYALSFITTEISLFIGLLLSNSLLSRLRQKSTPSGILKNDATGLTEFDIFAYIIACCYLICEAVNIKTVGIIILESDVNHVSAFTEHGILRALIMSFRTLTICVLYYKLLILKRRLNTFDIFCFLVLGFGLATSGSKSSIIIFFVLFFIIRLPLVLQGKIKQMKLSLPILILLACFPVAIVIITADADPATAINMVYIRLLASGDVFLLGYNDEVMSSITEKSFLKYALYPGWGSILKNLGLDITPPVVIGVDVFKHYYNFEGGGANARYNYLAFHFFGLWGSMIYSLTIGLFIGFVRNIFINYNPERTHYFLYLLLVLLAYYSPLLIDDINIFSNFSFWTVVFLALSFILSKCVVFLIKMLKTPVHG